jgi:hypothetical protein
MPPLKPLPSEFLTIHFVPMPSGAYAFRINSQDASPADFATETPSIVALKKYNITDEQYLAIRAMLTT